MSDEGFLSRWSRRKQQVKSGEPLPPQAPVIVPAPAAVLPVAPAVPAQAQPAASVAERETEPPLPTLDDVARLTRESDFSPFVRAGVDPTVKNAAMKKLFADPHFNIMDGLDVYIDDYGKPDPIPPSMLRQMAQSKLLGLFDDEPEEQPAKAADNPPAPAVAAAELPPPPTPDEDADLQLQPDDATGPEGAGSSADGDPGRIG